MRHGVWILGSRWSLSVVCSVVCGWVATGCDSSQDAEDTVAVLAAEGPYGVGYRTLETTYSDPVTGSTRTLSVLAWYPADFDPTGERPFYLLRTSERATVNASPLDLGPAAPVVVFSHGHQAYAAAASQLMEHLASHGWVAVAPNHTGNTVTDGERTTDIYYLRAYDLTAALDAIENLPVDDPLKPSIGEARAVMGHSFGGYTAYASAGARHAVDVLRTDCNAGRGPSGYCSTLDPMKEAVFQSGLRDPRWTAVVSIEAGDFDLFRKEGVAGVSVASLHVVAEGSGHAAGDPSADPYWNALGHPQDVRLLLRQGEHNDFVDACGAGLDLRCSDLTPADVQRALRVYVLAFLRQQLLGDGQVAAILAGSAAVSDLIEVTRR